MSDQPITNKDRKQADSTTLAYYKGFNRIEPNPNLRGVPKYELRANGLYYPILDEGIMTMADPEKPITPVAPKPSLLDALSIPTWAKILLFVLAGLASIPPVLAASGVAIPAWLVGVASAIASILSGLGIASGGMEKPKE